MRYSATLEFDKNISKIIFGYNPVKSTQIDTISKVVNTIYENYNYSIAGKIIIIQAAAIGTPETTVTIILEDNSAYTGVVKYNEEPKRYHYYFSSELPDEKNQTEKPVEQTRDLKSLNPAERFLSVLEDKNKYSFAAVNSKVYFVVTNIKNDDDNTYLKMMIVNESNKDFVIESISFIKVTESISTQGEVNSVYIEPKEAVYPIDNTIKANSSNRLGFMLPVYSKLEGGKMIIQILEKNGNRNADLEIKARDIFKIDEF
jgi:hypothetical protein